MDEGDRIVFALALRAALLEKRGAEFENFFRKAGHALWGDDFEPWRPQGRFGDLKCDGYTVSDRTVFQCYAPEQFDASKVSGKVDEDFSGALVNFGENMRNWVFVHNHDDGLPATAAQLMIELRTANPNVSLSSWSPTQLCEKLEALPDESMRILFPKIAKGQTFTQLTSELMAEFLKQNPEVPIAAAAAANLENRRPLDDALDELERRPIRLNRFCWFP